MGVFSKQEPKRSLAAQSKKLEALAEEGQIERESLEGPLGSAVGRSC